MSLKKEEWELSYLNKDNYVFYPHEEIIRFTAKFIAKRIGLDEVKYVANPKSKVLDLGCGIGRHIVFLSKLGIDTYGIDLSDEAIKITKKWLLNEGIESNGRIFSGSAEELPWKSNMFNFIISHGVLDSMPFSIAQNIITECHRVLSKEGLFYCDLIGDESNLGSNYNDEIIIDSNHEKGTIQSYFNIEKINQLFGELFKIIEVNKIVNYNVKQDSYRSRYHLVLKKLENNGDK